MKKAKIILISLISLIVIAGIVIGIVYFINKDKTAEGINTDKIEITTEKVDNSYEYHIGEIATFKINFKIENPEGYNIFISLDKDKKYYMPNNPTIETEANGKGEISLYNKNNGSYLEYSKEIENENETITTEKFDVYVFKYRSEATNNNDETYNITNFTYITSKTIPSYTWQVKTVDYDEPVTPIEPTETTVETKLDHYNFAYNSTVDESSNPNKMLVSDKIIVNEYFYTGKTLAELGTPTLSINNVDEVEATKVIKITDNYYVATYSFTFNELYPETISFGFNTVKTDLASYEYNVQGFYCYDDYLFATKDNWENTAIYQYLNVDYIDGSQFVHYVQDYTEYENSNGLFINYFGFTRDNTKFETEENNCIANDEKVTFFDGTYEDVYSIFSQEEFNYFIYWTYRLVSPRTISYNNNYLSQTAHQTRKYIVKGHWLITKDITISHFVDETIVRRILEGDTSYQYNTQIFNYSCVLDGLFDFNGHTVKYQDLDYTTSYGNGTFTTYWDHGPSTEQCKTNIDEYKTFSTYLTNALSVNDFETKYITQYNFVPVSWDQYDSKDNYAFSQDMNRNNYERDLCGTDVNDWNYVFEGEEFVNDYRYSLFVTLNDNSIKNINYDLTSLENSTDAFELLKAMNIKDYYCATWVTGLYEQYITMFDCDFTLD